MKKLLLVAAVAMTATGVFAQGVVVFFNASSAGTSHVYGPGTLPGQSLIGFGTADTPSGSVNYAAAGMLPIGQTLAQASSTFAQLLAANGSNTAEGSLVPMGVTTTFRSAGAAGIVSSRTDTLEGLASDGTTPATLEMVAWDNSSGQYSTWALASQAWQSGLIAAGKSGTFTIPATGGGLTSPPNLHIPSFNLYFVPEPSSFALAGLGAAAMLIFRRRK